MEIYQDTKAKCPKIDIKNLGLKQDTRKLEGQKPEFLVNWLNIIPLSVLKVS